MFGYVIRTILLFSAALAVRALKAPEIMLHPSLTATLGSSVRIDCVAQGDPRPNVTLYRNGIFIQGQEAATFSPLIPNLGGAKYAFTAVQGTEGPYECRATNGIADANGTTVIKKVINVIITVPQTAPPTTSTPQTQSSTATKTEPQTAPPTTSTPQTQSSTSTKIEPQTAPPTTSTTQTQSSTATKTGPTKTSPVITTKETVETEKNKNTGSGSYNTSAVAMIVVLSLVIAAFCCQR